jgi:hypothetical protein
MAKQSTHKKKDYSEREKVKSGLMAVFPTIDRGETHPQFTSQALLAQRQLPANFLDQNGKVLTVRLHHFSFAGIRALTFGYASGCYNMCDIRRNPKQRITSFWLRRLFSPMDLINLTTRRLNTDLIDIISNIC